MSNESPAVHYLDASAVTIWVAAFMNILPPLAAFLSVVWAVIRILETRTAQKLLGKYAWLNDGDKDNGKEP